MDPTVKITVCFVFSWTLMLPTPKNVWIWFNKTISLMCNSIEKESWICQPVLFLALLITPARSLIHHQQTRWQIEGLRHEPSQGLYY
jgi:hypothetical protein